jgi:hypothetical protein
VNLVGGTTIRLAPPLTVTRTEVRAALDTFRGGVYAALSAAEEARCPPLRWRRGFWPCFPTSRAARLPHRLSPAEIV